MGNVDMEFDEKTIIREQERLEREKKRAKRKKLYRILLVVVLLLAAVVTGLVVWRKNATTTQTTQVEIVKEAGQEIVIAKISQINGNEVTYNVCKEAEQTSQEMPDRTEGEGGRPEGVIRNDEGQATEGEGRGMGQMPEGMEMPDASQMGEMPEGMEMPDRSQMSEMPEGIEMPDVSQMGEMPEGMEMPDASQMGQMAEGAEMPDRSQGGNRGQGMNRGQQASSSGSEDTFVYEETTYTITDESVTTYIPVGTVVTTKLGTETTFSRLAAGDYVAFVVENDKEEQVIMAVYIIG